MQSKPACVAHNSQGRDLGELQKQRCDEGEHLGALRDLSAFAGV